MWQVIVAGSGQDAGVPQAGCSCKQCAAARQDPALGRLAPSLLVKNEETRQAVLFDTSPDIRQQLDRYLRPLDLRFLEAVFITHGHIGHYWGLPLLGKEGPDIHGVSVFASPSTVEMLRSTPAVSLMEFQESIYLKPCDPRDPVRIGSLTVKGFSVPHRRELTDTMGFLLRGQRKSLVYIPDIDAWSPEVAELVKAADIALLDGSFFSADELRGMRDMMEVPHPPIRQSLKVFKRPKPRDDSGNAVSDAGSSGISPVHIFRRGVSKRPMDQALYFTHLNHTNPAGLDGPEREMIRKAGLDVAFDGMKMEI